MYSKLQDVLKEKKKKKHRYEVWPHRSVLSAEGLSFYKQNKIKCKKRKKTFEEDKKKTKEQTKEKKKKEIDKKRLKIINDTPKTFETSESINV